MAKGMGIGGFLLVLGACDHGSASGSGAADAAREATQAAPLPSASHRAAPPPTPRPPPQPCKAATVIGTVNVVPFADGPKLDGDSIPVVASSIVPDDTWIDVGKASTLTARDAESTRETSYVGPGRFRVCIGHKEEAWVEEGTFESVGGAGERPGGEQWVATPLGVARYDAAKWRIVVTGTTVDARMAAGTGYFWPADGVTTQFTAAEGGSVPGQNDQGWVRLDSGTGAKLSVTKTVLTREGATAALERCVAAAKEAMALTASLAEPDASLADIAPKDIVARRLAHASCAVAHLRIETLPPSPSRDASLEQVRTAEAGWKALAPPPHPGPRPVP
jgi:hypothetical protein